MPPTARSRGTLPISCGVVHVSTRSYSTAAPFVLRSCAKGFVSRSRNGRVACRWHWKMRIPISLLRAARRYLEKSSIAEQNASKAGAARAVFLEVGRSRAPEAAEPAPPSLVCVLPRGAPSDQRFEITGLPLEVQTSRPARFQAYYSTRDDTSKAGDVADWSEADHHALPPLETVINVADTAPGPIA